MLANQEYELENELEGEFEAELEAEGEFGELEYEAELGELESEAGFGELELGAGFGEFETEAGILEIADLLVVTKADLPGARSTARDLRHMTHLRRAPVGGAWQAAVLSVSAATGEGIAALVEQIAAHGQAVGRGRRLHPTPAAGGARDGDPPSIPAPGIPAGATARRLGIEIGDGGARDATARLRVRAEHLDGAGACDRSVSFARADCAFDRASRSAVGAPVVLETHVDYVCAARRGDRLVATASEVSRSHDRAVYRVDIAADAARPIATWAATARSDPTPAS